MRRILLLVPLVVTACGNRAAVAESVTECQELFRTGQYDACLQATTEAIENRSYGEEWPILRASSELATGRYENAVVTVAAGLERYSWSVRILMLQHECARATGNDELAQASLTEVERLVQTASWRYTDADDLVALGQAALLIGADPRDVQEGFFDRARRNFETRPDGFLAGGRLAIAKNDFQLAAEILEPAAEAFPDNPDVLVALSKAVRSADAERATELLRNALRVNPHHAEALQEVTERQIDREDYDAAEETIDLMLSVNPHHPIAHALQAVIFRLRNEPDAAAQSIASATEFSGPSAEVNHLVGSLLSRKYRFREGADYQRAALDADPDFTEAKVQLAQDLLRLGETAEGWRLAEEAHEEDGYNTTVFNLLQLRDSLDRFTTLESEHFRLQLEQREAAVYGQRALDLLEEAWQVLSERYEYRPPGPVRVEIYPRGDDFAVRTFGIPDVAGFLGVCFGNVITANSPASRRENPSSWESVLWHEFCHVITLQMTGNRIPRWLSEGISVYEERRRDPRWGQHMTAEFRDRILDDRVTPVSRLSSAFLTAESGEDLNFAYYESSMVVEFLVERFGLPALRAILNDLNTGLTINDALQRRTIPIAELDDRFAEYLRERAAAWAPAADYDPAVLRAAAGADAEQLRTLTEANPGSIPLGTLLAAALMESGQLDEAETELRRLMELNPDDAGPQSPRRLLAEVCRRQSRPEDERRLLEEHASRNADDLAALDRLQELMAEAGRPQAVVEYGTAIRAIDPFQVEPARRLADAAEELGDVTAARSALRRLIVLVPDDAARLHFRLARLLLPSAPEQSRRHVLLSLELAPRYRAAHQLLLQLHSAQTRAP